MSRRAEMLGSTIQRELAEYLMREANDPRLEGLLVSITRIRVSDDFGFADVYVSIMGTPGRQTAALNALKHSAGVMRTKLNKALSIRQTPYLRFHIDEQLKKELETLDLLERVRQENEELDRRRAAAAGSGEGTGSGEETSAEDDDASDTPASPQDEGTR